MPSASPLANPIRTMKAILDTPNRTGAAFAGVNVDKPARILVVDDDESVCRCEAVLLKSVGHRVDTVDNGEAAWQVLLQSSYDLLITDYLMPGVSGLALVRQLRVANLDIPVVLVSGTLHTLDTAKLNRDPWTRIRAFVAKPFTRAELLAAVESALAGRAVGRRSGQNRGRV